MSTMFLKENDFSTSKDIEGSLGVLLSDGRLPLIFSDVTISLD